MRLSTAFAVSSRCRSWNSLTQLVTLFTISRADLRAVVDLVGLRLTRSARLTIFTFFSDIINGEQVESDYEINSGKFRPEGPDLLGKQLLDAGKGTLVAEILYRKLERSSTGAGSSRVCKLCCRGVSATVSEGSFRSDS